MEALWNALLDLTAQFVLPDWGVVITMIPVLLLVLVVVFFVWTGWRFATAGPTRSRPGRITPVTPPGVHTSAPSWSPLLAAVGAFLLFLGLVVGGPSLWIGVAALVVALLYWGREAISEFDRLVGAQPLPTIVHEGPPPGVHMPSPSFRPVLVSLAVAVVLLGLVVGGAILAVGVVFLVVVLLGWLNDARHEYQKTVEADRTGHLENLPAPDWPRRLLVGFGVLTVLAAAINLGILFGPPSETAGGGGPDASPGAPACEEPATDHELTALNIAFDQDRLCVPAGEPFTIHFVNDDPPGILHDVDVRTGGGEVVADQQPIDGGTDATYDYEALDAGEYGFFCSIHPNMTGTLVAQ